MLEVASQTSRYADPLVPPLVPRDAPVGLTNPIVDVHAQLETFKELVDVSGLIVTKLDGSARGGVIVALADRFGLPIYAIGVGEGADDLRPFSARDFAESGLGLSIESGARTFPHVEYSIGSRP